MLCFYNQSTDAYYNLAFEQALMDTVTDDIFMLWRNDRAVIVGKNQNAAAEVDRAYCEEHAIKVVRRLTGGGAVYHDLGNVNYTFITSAGESGLDFARFAEPVCRALASLGLEAALSGRNDIEANGAKISGNAQCVRNGKLLHHGTLLYDSDLGALTNALRVSPDKVVSKGIKSVRARVGNIKELAGLPLTTGEFIDCVLDFVRRDAGCTDLIPSGITLDTAAKLTAEVYSTPAWNFGAIRSYTYANKARFPWGGLEICFDVIEGKITSPRFYGDFFEEGDISVLLEVLNGTEYTPSAVKAALAAFDAGKYIRGAAGDDLYSLIL